MKKKLQKKIGDYQAFILDMDGTLYYQIPLRICMCINLILHYALHLKNIKELFILYEFRKLRESALLMNCANFQEYQYELLAERFQTIPELIKNVVEYWMQERPLKYIRWFRDRILLNLIQQFKSHGKKIIIYSDYPLEKKIDVLRPLQADFIFCSSDIEIMCLKPNTTGLKKIVEIIDEPIENILFIGDRYEKDGKCAEGVGMDYLILDNNPISRIIKLYSTF